MKRILGITLGIVLVLLLVMSVALADEEKQSGAFTYRIKGNGTAVITGYDWGNYQGEDVYIPRMVDGYTVTEIGENAFSDVGTVIVTLPDTITVIGSKAFENSNAAAIRIPESVKTIGDFAFSGCPNVQSFSIPANVGSIGVGAFMNCSKLQEFFVDSENPIYATIDGVLFNKSKKELTSFPTGKNTSQYCVPTGIESIGPYAFYGVDVLWVLRKEDSQLLLPETIREIGAYAFCDVKFERENENDIFYMPSSLESIGSHAFERAYLRKTSFGSSLKSIGDYAFAETYLYTDEDKLDTGRSLGKSLTLPASIQEIGEGAFLEISENDRYTYRTLKTIDLSKTHITIIEPKTFFECAVTKSILLPSSLIEIREAAFEGALSVNIKMKNVEIIGKRAFAYGGTANISVGNKLKEIGEQAFYGHHFNSQESFSLPDTVTSIGAEAFKNILALQKLIIPSSVEKIGDDLCDKVGVSLEVEKGSYAEQYALENGYQIKREESNDTSWLND